MTMVGVLLSLGRRLSDEPFIAMKTSFRDRRPDFGTVKLSAKQPWWRRRGSNPGPKPRSMRHLRV